MKIYATEIEAVKIVEPKVFGDHRGWFMETYKEDTLKALGIASAFLQDNHSYSKEVHTLRGLHFQAGPYAQTKLVRCTRGRIFDVAVDLRKESSSFLQWVGIELSAANKKQLLVPKGFAHGFLTLTEDVEVQYKVDAPYSAEHDCGICWNDSTIAVQWNLGANKPTLSEKDNSAPLVKDIMAKLYFA